MFLLVLAYPGSPGQKAVKRLCVCVCVQCYTDKHDLESNSEINYGKTRRDLYESKPHLPSHKTQVNSKSFISLTYDMTVLPVDCQHRLLSVTGNKNRSIQWLQLNAIVNKINFGFKLKHLTRNQIRLMKVDRS